ncbi:expressed unknown protein [Seminavis robusta]|uniref:Uncharacterized protein n=1 Tax=Seminavis robusta TaxID=568900 RepID=A0A9N8D6T9_9STRA|nr:expressed unknown protein [Seminavis robusta]|eukprot:Sro2_g001670.1 n/a (87) ;mRNA; f:222417-222677
MGNAGSALQAAQAQASVTNKFNKMTGGDEQKAPDPEEQKAKERMREERDRRNATDYADRKAAHAKNKKKLSSAWADHKKANSAANK